MRKLLVIIVLFSGCILCDKILAQDIHFSQFYISPITSGPGASGDFDGDMRFSTIQRRQWAQVSEPLVTSAVGIEKRIFLTSHHYLDLATIFPTDKLDILGYKNNRLYVNTTYEYHYKKSIFHIGLNIGYVNREVDLSEQTFPSQFDGSTGYYDAFLANNENISTIRNTYTDVAIGGLWVAEVGKAGRNHIKNGLNLFHTNQPNEAYIGFGSILPVRFQYYHESIFWVNQKWTMRPYFQYMQTRNAVNVLSLITAEFEMPSYQKIFAGVGLRGYVVKNDAFILLVGTEYQRLRLTVSYDINISSLSDIGTRKSAFELSLVYVTPAKRHAAKKYTKKLPCPKF